MNRKNEYEAMLMELSQPALGLETTLDRAYLKKNKKSRKMIVHSLTGVAACFAVFVLLVNFCAPVAYACSLVPGLRELSAAVMFSRSLTEAVENDFVQPMELSQTENGITAEIAYLIVDQKQVNIFYRLHSDQYETLSAVPTVSCEDKNLGFALLNRGYGEKNGELLSVTVDFLEQEVPDQIQFGLCVYEDGIMDHKEPEDQPMDTMTSHDPAKELDYLAEFAFLLKFDPKFTATGKVFPVQQTVMMDGQSITITDIEVYPTHMRVDIAESQDNTAWLIDLDFYIETDWGMRFDAASSGITATGSGDSPSMVSYRADSTYFYQADRLKLVITGAKWLRKDMETTYVNLRTGAHGELPEGALFDSARREGDDWVIRFQAVLEENGPMYQLFKQRAYDAEGNAYEINRWSNRYGEPDEDNKITYFYDEFPLTDYPYDEVWLCPQYSHNWTAEDLIVIHIQ